MKIKTKHQACILFALIILGIHGAKMAKQEIPPLPFVYGQILEDSKEAKSQNGVQNNYTINEENGDTMQKIAYSNIPGEWSKWNDSSLSVKNTGGVVKTAETATWTESTFDIHARLVSLKYDENFARYMINGCKKKTKDPRHCVITAGFLWKNESGAGNAKNSNNVFGFRYRKFDSKEKAFDAWIEQYLEKWQNTKGPRSFYSPKPWLPPTRYCVDELQLNGKTLPYCPIGYAIALSAYKILTK